MEQPEIALHMATAKRGTWKNLTDLALSISKLMYNSYTCDFSTKDDGSFFVMAEGPSIVNRMILVAPDNSLDFASMLQMNVVDALQYVANFTATSPIPGWNQFVVWLSNNLENYLGNVQSMSIFSHEVNPIPSYSNPNRVQSVLFTWLKQCAENAGGSSVPVSGYSISNNKISIPVNLTVSLGNGNSREFALQIQMAV